MKTPREILLECHRPAEPKLDGVRRQALVVKVTSARAERISTGRDAQWRLGVGLQQAWMQLIWPSRRAWAGLAALWLVVLAENLEQSTAVPTAAVARSESVRELAQGLEEQRRLLTELLEGAKTAAPVPAHLMPKPRSERSSMLRPC